MTNENKATFIEKATKHIEDKLDLKVVSIKKLIGNSPDYDSYDILTVGLGISHTFIGDDYHSNPEKSKLTLKEIYGPGGVYETNEVFYLGDAQPNKRGEELLASDLKKLL